MQYNDIVRQFQERIRGKQVLLLVPIVAAFIGWEVFEWTVNRIYVPQGFSLMLQYKGPLVFGNPPSAQPGHFAKVDENGNPIEVGQLERMVGPGRHFYCPIWWVRELVPDQVVKPGQVALVSSKMGDELKEEQFLVDGDIGETKYKGILRKVYGPGRYRVNSYAYKFDTIDAKTTAGAKQMRMSGWVSIPTGYVGVVTHLTEDSIKKTKAGIDDNVLQPGLYLVNPREEQIDVVEIGFREKSFSVARKMDRQGQLVYDASGEPTIAVDAQGGLRFTSNDGYEIYMDFTLIWGLFPMQAPHALRNYGTIDEVENKIIQPQITSICNTNGAKWKAPELLVGETRQKFQSDISEAFHNAQHHQEVTLSNGLIRYISIPQEIRGPIQKSFVADENKLTLDQQQITQKTNADLSKAEQNVKFDASRTEVETTRMVAQVKAEGQKKAEEIKAKTTQLVAAIDKDTAELEAKATVLKGEAEAKAQQLLEEAKAQKFELAVKAFGGGESYNQWVFATGLPSDIKLSLFYAGQGTFWTDLKGFSDIMLGKQAQQEMSGPKIPQK